MKKNSALCGKSGRLFVISAPSGSGKTTIIKALRDSEPNVVLSVSATTRAPRRGEKNGLDYWFVGKRQFESMQKENKFLEHAAILNNWYGTPKQPIVRALRQGKDVFLEIDIQGADQIKKSGFPATTIFLMPPSLEALSQRLKKRGTETVLQIQARLRLARRELQEAGRYDYVVVNDRLREAIEHIKAIVRAERCRVKRKE